MFPDDRRFVLALAFRQACKSHFLHKAISCIDMFCAGQDMSEGSSWMMSLRLWRGRRFRQKAFSRRTKSWISIICANRIVLHDPQHDLQWFGSETRKPWTQIELFVAFDRFFQIIFRCSWQRLQAVKKTFLQPNETTFCLLAQLSTKETSETRINLLETHKTTTGSNVNLSILGTETCHIADKNMKKREPHASISRHFLTGFVCLLDTFLSPSSSDKGLKVFLTIGFVSLFRVAFRPYLE